MNRARGPRSGPLTPVGEIGGRLPAGPGAVGQAAARAAWRLVAGPELARRLPLVEAAGDTWRVALPGPAWAAEIPGLEAQLLPRLRQLPCGAGVRRLVGVLDPRPPAPPAPIPSPSLVEAAPRHGTARDRLERLAGSLLARRAAEEGSR